MFLTQENAVITCTASVEFLTARDDGRRTTCGFCQEHESLIIARLFFNTGRHLLGVLLYLLTYLPTYLLHGAESFLRS